MTASTSSATDVSYDHVLGDDELSNAGVRAVELVEPSRASDASDDTAAAVVTCTTAVSSSPGWLRYADEFRGATATLYVVLGYTTKSP